MPPVVAARPVAFEAENESLARRRLVRELLVVATDGQLPSGDPISFAALGPNAFDLPRLSVGPRTRTLPIAFLVGDVASGEQKEFMVTPQAPCALARLRIYQARMRSAEERAIMMVLEDLIEDEAGARGLSIPDWAQVSIATRARVLELETQYLKYGPQTWNLAQEVSVLSVRIGVLNVVADPIRIEMLHKPYGTLDALQAHAQAGEAIRTTIQNHGRPGQFQGVWFVRT